MVELLKIVTLLLALALSVGWGFVLFRALKATAALARLPHHALPPAGQEPRVSVVLSARNEEQLIERCVRSLLAQEGVHLQVVAIDDSSEDRTLELLHQLAAADDRLLVLKNEKLPKGWVAKNYALELGQGRAEGDYLLFTDADVIFGRRALMNAVQVMQEQRLDHLAVHPRLEASAFIEAVVLPLYFLLAEFRFIDPRAVNPASGVGAGIGAFNLVRAESYRLRGTHARIRGAVLDDRALGRMMRDDGGRGTVMRSTTQVRMRPYRTLGDLYVGIRKGVLSAFGNSALLAFVMSLGLAFGAIGPFVILLSGGAFAWFGHIPWGSLLSVAAIVLPVLGLLRARAMVKFQPVAALLFPVGAILIAVATLHAALVFGARGTVEWRGRQYTRRDLNEMGY